MTCKGFRVHLHLELHAITCPGVWLCPNGKVALRITTLGSTLESHRVSPIFPLLFHNEFNFKKTFTRLAALTELQRTLDQDNLYAELIQWVSPQHQPVLLASFEASLTDVLYPLVHCKRLLAGVDVDLLMDPSKSFPGIIAPKIEISTKTVIEEVAAICDESPHYAYVGNPKIIDSKQKSNAHRTRPTKGITRQRKVCHTRPTDRIESRDATGYRCQSCCNVRHSCQADLPRINRFCYHPAKEKSKCPSNDNGLLAKRQVPPLCGNSHIFDNCPVCLKYRCYFSCQCNRDPIIASSENPTNFHDCRRCLCGDRPWPDRDSQIRAHHCSGK